MSIERELNLKISAQSFEIKNLEIKDGRLELVLSAMISDTEIEESDFDYQVKTNQYVEVDGSPDEVTEYDHNSHLAPVIDLEDDARHGEPESDIEWQAVNQDDFEDEVSEIELEDEIVYPDEEVANSSKSTQELTLDSEPQASTRVVEEDTQQQIILDDSELPQVAKTPIINMEEEEDVLPDYLKSAIANNDNKCREDVPKSEPSIEERKRASHAPTEVFPRVKPALNNENSEDSKEGELTENETDNNIYQKEPAKEENVISNDQPQSTHCTQNEPEKRRVVKFCCPRCKTQGSQDIASIGSIITCNNCGRALKLNVKK